MKINCDQVTWIKEAFDRYHMAMLASEGMPKISKLHYAARLASLLEIMEILGLEAEDSRAIYNAMIGLNIPEFGKSETKEAACK